jgi:hypothetical protein
VNTVTAEGAPAAGFEDAPAFGEDVWVDVRFHQINEVTGTAVTLPFQHRAKISDRLSARIDVPLQYATLAGHDMLRGGLNLAFPVKITEAEKLGGLHMTATPFLGAYGHYMWSFDTTACYMDFGLAWNVEKDLGPFSVSYANSLTYFTRLGYHISEFRVNIASNDWALATVLKGSYAFRKNWCVDMYLADNRSLVGQPSPRSYQMWGGGLNYRRTPGGTGFEYARLGVERTFGTDYGGWHFKLSSGFTF